MEKVLGEDAAFHLAKNIIEQAEAEIALEECLPVKRIPQKDLDILQEKKKVKLQMENNNTVHFNKNITSEKMFLQLFTNTTTQEISHKPSCENKDPNQEGKSSERNLTPDKSILINSIPCKRDFNDVINYKKYLQKHDINQMDNICNNISNTNLQENELVSRNCEENVDFLLLPELPEEVNLKLYSPTSYKDDIITEVPTNDDMLQLRNHPSSTVVSCLSSYDVIYLEDSSPILDQRDSEMENQKKIEFSSSIPTSSFISTKCKKQVHFSSPLHHVVEYEIESNEQLDDTELVDESCYVTCDPYKFDFQAENEYMSMESNDQVVPDFLMEENIQESSSPDLSLRSCVQNHGIDTYDQFVNEIKGMALKSSPLFSEDDNSLLSVSSSPCILSSVPEVTSSPELIVESDFCLQSPIKKKQKLNYPNVYDNNRTSSSLVDRAMFVWYHSYITAFYLVSSLIIEHNDVNIHERKKLKTKSDISNKNFASENILQMEKIFRLEDNFQAVPDNFQAVPDNFQAVPDIYCNDDDVKLEGSFYQQIPTKNNSHVDEMLCELMLSQAVRKNPFNKNPTPNRHFDIIQKTNHKDSLVHPQPRDFINSMGREENFSVFRKEKVLPADSREEDGVVPEMTSFPATKLLCTPQKLRIGLSKNISRTKKRLHPYRTEESTNYVE